MSEKNNLWRTFFGMFLAVGNGQESGRRYGGW
jgi:hypothetical protein